MPTYEYKCPECGNEMSAVMSISTYVSEQMDWDMPNCGQCHYQMHRVYTPLPHVMDTPGHYNLAVGAYVSSDSDLREKLKAASEQASIKTGIDHDYRPVDMRDRERFKVDGSGLESTARARHDAGKTYLDPDSV